MSIESQTIREDTTIVAESMLSTEYDYSRKITIISGGIILYNEITDTETPLQDVNLHPHQREVIDETIAKKHRTHLPGICLSLPMGFGKTIISLSLGLRLYRTFLVICSKTLISSWVSEINKFYGNTLPFEILHPDYLKSKINDWIPNWRTRVVITTPEMVSKSYTSEVREMFIGRVQDDTDYRYPKNPFATDITGIGYLHTVKWEGVFIDECQNYTSVTSSRCQAIASICSKDRWLLSGTMLQEVNINRILGLFLLLNVESPRNITSCKHLVYHDTQFQGLDRYCVQRTANPSFQNVKLNSRIIIFDLSREEAICYNMLREIITDLWEEYRKAIEIRDNDWARRLSGNLLAMITYLRQALVIPQIPICKLITKMTEESIDNDPSESISNDMLQLIKTTLDTTMNRHNLTSWLSSPESAISTRVRTCLDLLLSHIDDVVIVFASYVVCLNFLKEKLTELVDIPTFILSSDMNIKKREQVLKDFKSTTKGVLFMTYMMGSEGLNLQHANTVIHLDLYWNKGKENQALARVFRAGQISPTVHQYIMISNTGLEEAMLQKQLDKLTILEQLRRGVVTQRTVTEMHLKDLVEILRNDQVRQIAHEVNNSM